MEGTHEITSAATFASRTHRDVACLVAGCPCKDPRIVSTRRARFFAALARRRGETADRVIAPDPAWRLPSEAPLRPSFGAFA